MPFSLYHASVGAYLQILPSVAGLVTKAEAHCAEQGLPAEAITGARLADDMWPFAKQVSECVHHSAKAITGLRAIAVAGASPLRLRQRERRRCSKRCCSHQTNQHFAIVSHDRSPLG